MDHKYLELDPMPFLVKDYPNDEPDVDSLVEVYIVVYTLERKGKEPQEIYTFTCDFEQAYKRYKLLPHTRALLKRVLTDDENLIRLGRDGTKPKADNDSCSEPVDAAELTAAFNRLVVTAEEMCEPVDEDNIPKPPVLCGDECDVCTE